MIGSEEMYRSLDKCLEIISRLNNYVTELEEESKELKRENSRLKRERLYLATKLSKALPVSAKPNGWVMIAEREANKGEEDE